MNSPPDLARLTTMLRRSRFAFEEERPLSTPLTSNLRHIEVTHVHATVCRVSLGDCLRFVTRQRVGR